MTIPRPLKMILYAAFIGLLLASYVSPLQDIVENHRRISALRADIEEIERENAAKERTVEDLQTPEGVERTARERYGMIKPGEKVYIVPEEEVEP